MTERPSDISLVLPRGWVEVDPRRPDVTAALQRQLDVPPDGEAAVAALLAPLTVRLGRLAAAGDIVLTGFFADVTDVEGEEPFVMTAQVMLALSPPIGDLASVQELLGGDGVDVSPIELPAGTGMLVSGTTEVDDEMWDEPQPAHLRRYFVPVPGMSRVAALSFLTPNLDLVDQFDEVFDAIAGTLAFA